MTKKRITIAMTALLIGALILGINGSVRAQTDTPTMESNETLPAPEVTITPFGRGFGCDETCDADGDGEPDRMRLRDGSHQGGQNGFGPGDGSCDADGDGEPDQLRLRDGSGTGQQHRLGQHQGRGMMGRASGRGLENGQGLRDGSCQSD